MLNATSALVGQAIDNRPDQVQYGVWQDAAWAAVPASIAWQSAATHNGSGTTQTIPFAVASAAGQERLLAIALISTSVAAATMTVTIDGQAATQVSVYVRKDEGSGNGLVLSFWRAAGTGGTSVDVVATLSHSAYCAYGSIWTLSNVGILHDASWSDVIADATLDVDTVTDGVVAAAGAAYHSGGGAPAAAWTGTTERFDGHTLFGNDKWTGADAAPGSGPLAILLDWSTLSGTAVQTSMSLSFRPQ